MEDINLFIKENVREIGSSIYVTPEIPEKKLNNAVKVFGCESFHESILAIYDDTFLGSAKEGLVFTGKKMIHHQYGEFIYSDINSVEYIEDITVNGKGKEKKEEFIIITTKDNNEHKLEDGLKDIDKKKFADFLEKIITEFDNYKEVNQLKALEEMPEELKITYLKIIINMTFVDDLEIDKKELAELFLLMTRIELDKDSRYTMRSYISEISQENIILLSELFNKLKELSEPSLYESIVISLVKDLANIYLSSKYDYDSESDKKISDIIDKCLQDFKFIEDNKDLFDLSNEKIKLAIEAIKTDYENFHGNRDDDAIKKSLKELSAKAAAAGTPLAAIYISGSVVGMSAAGITSGLATLGMGLGMTGGIAAVAIIGILSYKGVKHLTGANELDKYKTRELMIHQVLLQTQKTISLIIDDLNYIVGKLNDAILNHSEQTEKIKKLMKIVAQFQGALKSVDNKSNQCKNSINRIKCPKILDETRLKFLTNDVTTKGIYEFIIKHYELKPVNTKDKKEVQLMLNEDIDTRTIEKMADYFKAIRYFDMENAIKGKATDGINKLKDIIKKKDE